MALFRYIWFYAVLVVIAGSTAWWIGASSHSTPSSNPNQISFRWENGCQNSYDFALKTDTNFGRNFEHSYSLLISGTLNMRVFIIDGKLEGAFHYIPSEVLANGQRDILLEEFYAIPFYINLSNFGAFDSFAFPESITTTDTDKFKQLVYGLETILPPNQSQYTAVQKDQMGNHLVKYTRKMDKAVKQKLTYTKGKNPGNRALQQQVDIKSSHFDFAPDKKGCWLEYLKGKEELKVSVGNDSSAFVTNAVVSISLKKRPYISQDTVFWASSSPEDLLKSYASRTWKKPLREIRKESALDKVLHSKTHTLESLLASILNDDENTIKLLERYLETHTDEISRIPDLIFSNELNDKTVAETILALGRIGSPEAQKALIEIWNNPAVDEGDRMQTLLAFTNLEKPPTEEVFNALLFNIEDVQSGVPNPDLITTPVLVCGVIVKNIRDTHPDKARKLNQSIIDQLNNAANKDQTKILLLALGNSRAEGNVEIIEEYIHNDDPILRETAVRISGRYQSEQLARVLLEILPDEKEPILQVGILESLRKQPLDLNDIYTIRDLLNTSPDNEVRAAAIETLGAQKSLNPTEIKEILKNSYQQETSRENLKKIIRALNS